ncbi:MAG: carboxylesterase/lipase family protein [Desertimonas sp.]
MSEIVELPQGAVRGRVSGGVTAHLGIPYAAAPFGERRMRPPEPGPTWSGTRDAIAYGPTVPKSPYASPYDTLLNEPDLPGDECLNLNVWAPVDADAAPVLVWIHGGAFVNGTGAVPQYDGRAFARDGIVCVTINYRLGADGFLDVDGGTTNIALRDQVAALTWVRDHIARFGGDPGRVTIAGESAGAMSVTTLASMPAADGLFRRVIAQSGAGHHAIGRDDAQRVAGELAARLGVTATRDALAAVPIDRLLAAQAALSTEVQLMPDPARWGQVAANLMPFEPVLDGDVLDQLPIDAIRAGRGAGVEVLIGTNTDENRLFMEPTGAIGMIDDALLDAALAGYGLEPDAVRAAYSTTAPAGASPGDLLAAVSTDWMFRIPALRLAEAHQAAAPTYVYEFAWPSPVRAGALGACHFLEVPFAFDTLAAAGSNWLTGPNPPQSLADEVHRAWVGFITDGTPGWVPYDLDRRTAMRFDLDSHPVDDIRADQRMLWDGRR